MLLEGEYRPIEVREVDGKHIGVSEVLGLEFHANAEWFRFFDPVSGEYLPDSDERKRAQEEAERGRAEAEQGRDESERERQHLESLLREHGIDPTTGLRG